jgi:hypothetical protein
MGPVLDLKKGDPALYPQVVGLVLDTQVVGRVLDLQGGRLALHPQVVSPVLDTQVEDVALYTHRKWVCTTPTCRSFSPLHSQVMRPVLDTQVVGPALYPQVAGPVLHQQVVGPVYTRPKGKGSSTIPTGRRCGPLHSQEVGLHYTHSYKV